VYNKRDWWAHGRFSYNPKATGQREKNAMKFVIAICCTTMLVTCQEAAAATPALPAVDF
jgi:hypothetical protein